jgi:hypothetical protein
LTILYVSAAPINFEMSGIMSLRVPKQTKRTTEEEENNGERWEDDEKRRIESKT